MIGAPRLARMVSRCLGLSEQVGYPQRGEILWYEEHAHSLCPEVTKKGFEELTNAWVRHRSDCACPFRYEDGHLVVRQKMEAGSAMELTRARIGRWSRMTHWESLPRCAPVNESRTFGC